MRGGVLAPLVHCLRGLVVQRRCCLGHWFGAQRDLKLGYILKVKALRLKANVKASLTLLSTHAVMLMYQQPLIHIFSQFIAPFCP